MYSSSKITVLITEDQALFRESLSTVINSNPSFQVVGCCNDAENTIQRAEQLQPAVIILDINLPGMNGFEATAKLKEKFPSISILGLSNQAQPAHAFKMIKAGATGYITKNVSVTEMFEALTQVANQKQYISRAVIEKMTDNFMNGEDPLLLLNSLTERENDIIMLIQKGYSYRQIAETLQLSESTIQAHRSNIFKKLKVSKTVTLIQLVNKFQGHSN